VDATHVKEPGKTGSVWRIHYSLSWPSLRCDYLRLSPMRGEGNGESLSHLPVKAGDCLLADRAYATAEGIHQISSQKADMILRLNPHGIRVLSPEGVLFPFVERLQAITRPGQVEQRDVSVPFARQEPVRGRVCALRKSTGGFVTCRYQRVTPRLLPAGAAVAGWVIFLPLEERVLSTGALGIRA
jgi:hypothetical protein